MPTKRRPLRYDIVTLHEEFADFGLRTGDRVRGPHGRWCRVVLVIGPRQLVAREPLFWHDHLWLWAAWLIDRWRMGPQNDP